MSCSSLRSFSRHTFSFLPLTHLAALFSRHSLLFAPYLTHLASLVALLFTLQLEAFQKGENLSGISLQGKHTLLYSMAKGGSNGKLGPFVGKVQQDFLDDENFINSVSLGPLMIRLQAVREILTDRNVRVKFKNTSVSLFGNCLVNKETKGQGVWKMRYFNKDPTVGRRIRVMDTPSLFIIEENN